MNILVYNVNMKCEQTCNVCQHLNSINAQLEQLQLAYEQAVKLNEELKIENALQSTEIAWYKEQARLAAYRRFGHSRQSTEGQLALFEFNEAEQHSDPKAEEPVLQLGEQPKRRQSDKLRKPRRALWEGLPRRVTVHALGEEERVCAVCGEEMHLMDKEVTVEIEVIPAQFRAHVIERGTYVCDKCAASGVAAPIVTASAPKRPLEKSLASASLLAYIMDLKYSNGMPLNRIANMLRNLDMSISKQNMSNWVINGAELWLKLIYDELHHQLLQQQIIHSDETHTQVLREPGRSPETKSSMWLYCSGAHAEGQNIVLYDYQQTKAAKWPKEFLRGFSGYINVDGAQSYVAAGLPNTTLVGCWSHARAAFVEALKAAEPGSVTWNTHTARGIEFCDMLFELEREYDKLKLSPEERYRERLIYSKEVLDTFHAWLIHERDKVTPKSKLGQAFTYCINQWVKLSNFLLDGRLEVSNNRAERLIRPFVVGRKAWLFSDTPRGASSSAVIYSIIETAKANGLKPFDYLKWLFEVMPNTRLTDENLRSLLPWSAEIPASCRFVSD